MSLRKTIKFASAFIELEQIYVVTIGLFFCLLAVLIFCVSSIHWDGYNVLVLDEPYKLYTVAGNRGASLRNVFDEILSWGWILVAMPLLYFGIMTALSNSFTVSGLLWLRLIIKSSFQVQLARVFIVLYTYIVFILIGGLWIISLSLFFKLNFLAMSCIPLRILGHIGFASGAGLLILTITGRQPLSVVARHLISFLSLVLPCLLFFPWRTIYADSAGTSEASIIRLIPWAVPLSLFENGPVANTHVFSAICCGLLCAIGSLVVPTISDLSQRNKKFT
jgi:hypothetical protein